MTVTVAYAVLIERTSGSFVGIKPPSGQKFTKEVRLFTSDLIRCLQVHFRVNSGRKEGVWANCLYN